MVDQLGSEYEFRIVTSDRDIGDSKAYPAILADRWQPVSESAVYYVSPKSRTFKGIIRLLRNTPHDILYLNSFFDPVFTIRVFLARRLGLLPPSRIIVAPRGEFSKGSIRLKYLKKYVYIQIAKCIGLYKKIRWQASSEFERLDIVRLMKARPESVHIVPNLPTIGCIDRPSNLAIQEVHQSEGLRIVFLSRVSREKNLDYALRVLNNVRKRVVFDIYGPAEDLIYWKECRKLIAQLPPNITANYRGGITHDEVEGVLRQYDLLFFPTSGESYGHVIIESLLAGTRVLISTETPWRNLQDAGLGWDVDLKQLSDFVAVIEGLIPMESNERLKKQAVFRSEVLERIQYSAILDSHRQLFA